VQPATRVGEGRDHVGIDRRDRIDLREGVGLCRHLLRDDPTRDVVASRRIDRGRLRPSQPRIVATEAG
jgi:hypothetical protein